jgi:Adenine deaminase
MKVTWLMHVTSLLNSQGGLIVVKNGKTLASLPFQLGRILSTDPIDKVQKTYKN